MTGRLRVMLYHSDSWDIEDLTHLLNEARQFILHSIVRCLGTMILLWMRKKLQTLVLKLKHFALITTSSR